MKLGVGILCSLIVSSTSIARSSLFDSWTHSDLKSYVEDQQKNLEKLGSKSFEELKQGLSDAWHRDNHKAWWEPLWPHHHPSVLSSEPVTEWLFETWPVEGLRGLLESHGIYPHLESTKDQLVKYVKDNFELISEGLDTSGLYPSASYFQGWSSEDFKRWLEKYEIPFEEGVEDLLDTVRGNIFHVSKEAEDKRLRILKELDLSSRELLDSVGNIREGVFESWSNEDLKKWLDSHGIPYSDEIADERDRLIALASSERQLLKDDIEWLREVVTRDYSGFLANSPEYIASVWHSAVSSFRRAFDDAQNKLWDVINNTLLIDLDRWSRDRIMAFLDYHGISYSNTAGVEQLRELAREVRDTPIRKFWEKYEQLVDGSWYYDLRGWVQEKSQEAQNSDYYKWLRMNAESLGRNFQEQVLTISKRARSNIQNHLRQLDAGNDLFNLITKKTNAPISIKRQSWYEKWSNNARNMCSRLFGTMIGH